jgi:spermidine synthase
VATNFAKENYNVVKNPRVQVVYDDARNYVLTSKDKFDIITSDPIHPWVKGAATLYTKEYFEMCREHLNPGGFVTQWVPLYESNPGVVKSEIATFFDVFPDGTIWANDENGKGYDIVLLGQAGPTKINVNEVQDRLDRSDYTDVAVSLRDVGFKTVVDLLGTYGGQGPDLQPWLRGAQINRDRNLRLQYLAGMGLNLYQEVAIFDDMELHRKFPENLFIASDTTKMALSLAIERSGR